MATLQLLWSLARKNGVSFKCLQHVLITFCRAPTARACSSLMRPRSIIEGRKLMLEAGQLRLLPAVLILSVTLVYLRFCQFFSGFVLGFVRRCPFSSQHFIYRRYSSNILQTWSLQSRNNQYKPSYGNCWWHFNEQLISRQFLLFYFFFSIHFYPSSSAAFSPFCE